MKLGISLMLAIALFTGSCNNDNRQVENNQPEKTMDTTPVIASANKATPVVSAYRNELEYGKIKFIITSPQSATANSFTIAMTGFTISNETIMQNCEGIVVKSEVADIDRDNGPELLVVTQSGESKKGTAYVFSSNNNKSISQVNLPDFRTETNKAAGNNGQDDFALVESSFVHRFPLFENDKPISKTRQLQYRLKPGEAMKQLILYKTVEY